MKRAVLMAAAALALAAAGFGSGFLAGHDKGWREGKAWGILVGVRACLNAQELEPRPGNAL